MEWFYGWVLGIRQAPGSVGWKHILIAPEFGSLDWAKGETRTPQGVVKVSWRRRRDTGEGRQSGSQGPVPSPRSQEPDPVTLDVDIPKGSHSSIPTYGRFATVDGKRYETWPAKPMIDLGPGRHRVVLN
jgi:hypothetical protein